MTHMHTIKHYLYIVVLTCNSLYSLLSHNMNNLYTIHSEYLVYFMSMKRINQLTYYLHQYYQHVVVIGKYNNKSVIWYLIIDVVYCIHLTAY